MNLQTHKYKLVDGEFSGGEAHEILMALINSKIDFHSLYAFSNKIRFNSSDEDSKNRVDELMQTRDAISALIKKADDEGYNFSVKSDISIELVKKS